jgi:TPR repeat protein
MKKLVAVALFSLALSSVAVADFNSGVAAYMRGDYSTAAQQLIPLAETADDGLAQYFLGNMYAKGQGVDQSAEQAAKWYRSAAEKGIAPAQYRLGVAYRDGQGVPQDLENAYAWLKVADKLGSKLAPTALTSLDGKLTPEELAEAEKLAAEYTTKYGTPKKEADGRTEPIKADEAALRQP